MLVVFGSTIAYLSLFAGLLQRIGDEGTLVYGAARVAAGAVPYRDFADLANPLSYLWLGSWFAVLGTQLAVARALLVLTGACTSALVFWVTARAYGVRAGLTAGLLTTVLGIPFWPGTNHHWDSNLFFVVAVCCLALWQRRPSASLAVLTGVAAGITAGFMINKGAFALLVAMATVGWRQGRVDFRSALATVFGFAATIGAIALFFVLHGAAADFFYTNVVFPTTRYATTGRVPYAFYFLDVVWRSPMSVLVQVLPHAVAAGTTVILAVPIAAVAVLPLWALALAAIRVNGGRLRWGGDQALLWTAGVALWIAEAHRLDLFHLIYGSPLLFAAVLGETIEGAKPGGWRLRLVSALTVCALALGVWQGAIGLAAQVHQETRRGEARAYVRDEALQFLLDSTKPGDQVFIYPYSPMYYFLADLRNPTRYGILLHGYNSADQFREALADLERTKPRYVLWDTVVDGDNWKRWYPSYVSPSEEDLIIEPYLLRHYQTISTKNGFRIMERVGEQPTVK